MPFINIEFPFKDSPEGHFLNLTKTDEQAVKSDLMHLLLTSKGKRLFNPEFGTLLRRFIFAQNDNITENQVKDDIKTQVRKYLPKLTVTDVFITRPEGEEHTAIVRLDYTITDDVFTTTDFVVVYF